MTRQATASSAEVTAAVDTIQGWLDRRQRAMLAHIHSCGQSPAQLHVLGVLREVAPITVSHLATRLGISPPSASAIVDRMVDGGLVARERSEEDRRIVSVSLTPAGEAALKEAVGGRRGWLERILSRLDPDELRDTVRVMNRLERALDEERPEVVRV
jgi:DNA-binding MarR family transcriptional regulator